MIGYMTAANEYEVKKLPADAMHPLFAFSLRRKLRHMYEGNYFQYKTQNNEILEYPEEDRDLDGSTLIKIYDQKARFGVPSFDASQEDESKCPVIMIENGHPVASFNMGEYLDLSGAAQYLTEPNFTVTVIGDGDVPRPMIGIYGASDIITVEPGSPTSRFSFNDTFGSISENANNRINQLFSGVDPSQNGKQVVTMKNDGGGKGQNISSNLSTSFTNVSIGKAGTRFFKGTFIEATLHLSDLTKIGADQIWEEAKEVY